MKQKIYVRAARATRGRGLKTRTSHTPDYRPLLKNEGSHHEVALPTVMFAIELEVPDAAFDRAEKVLAEIKIDPAEVEVATQVTYPEDES